MSRVSRGELERARRGTANLVHANPSVRVVGDHPGVILAVVDRLDEDVEYALGESTVGWLAGRGVLMKQSHITLLEHGRAERARGIKEREGFVI